MVVHNASTNVPNRIRYFRWRSSLRGCREEKEEEEDQETKGEGNCPRSTSPTGAKTACALYQ